MATTIVIFGASGDLTSRKLIPSLYQLHRKKRLPEETRIVGSSRTPFSHEAWRKQLGETTHQFCGKDFDEKLWTEFAAKIFYHAGDLGSDADMAALKKTLEEIEGSQSVSRIYYLATAPQFYLEAIDRLGKSGLADESQGTRRVVIEKPFGTDFKSANALNEEIHRVFRERQVYRIDHYLGKETVQNILVLRFANSIFEPLWNRNYIDHVQITAAEEVVVGRRAGYYDTSGVMRDMFQNHLLQLLSITAMEAPSRFEADLVRNEKVKVLQSIRPMTPEEVATKTLRSQYKGYLQEKGVAPESQTPTYAVAKLKIDNWRWQGVPFYLRSGKAMSCRTTQIVIQFRDPPHMLFATEKNKRRKVEANRLIIHIQPAEGIQVHFQTKVPDAGMSMRLTTLDFRFDSQFAGTMPDGYERLLLDVMTGDPSLFARADEVELAWGIVDPILQSWQDNEQPAMTEYEPGMWGPDEAIYWMGADNRTWLDVCPVLPH
ncbi:MAG: glucose-6-phosphate dehydrogenase [Planctomycetia bacterium]|nr:glucose-6-phosphate dehydrogenase [Planctomycetia bacterium]